MEWWITIIATALGSAGFYSLIQFFFTRKFKKDDEKDEIKRKLDDLTKISRESALDRSRSLLLILICHYPEDEQVILAEAERYFIKLEGDSWMWSIVSEWAEQRKVNIEYLRLAHKNNKKGA